MNLKHLLNGAAVAAALTIAGPVCAQTNPSAGNGMGVPGPNPGGGGGPTPYSGGGYPNPGGSTYIPPAATAPTPAPAEISATPPAYHAVRHAKAMHAFHKGMAHKAALTGDTTAQLNREELTRIQSGAPPTPPMPPAPMAARPNPSGGNAEGLPGPKTWWGWRLDTLYRHPSAVLTRRDAPSNG
jgi:hypothetical protein